MNLVSESRGAALSDRRACAVLDLCRNTIRDQRQTQRFCGPPKPRCQRRSQPQALSEVERTQVLALLNSPEFCDQPPAEVYGALLEQGRYLCSISTMHRLLRTQHLGGERRAQRAPQSQAIPRLHARAPHEVWTWDITKLPTQRRGEYLSLYVVMDLYSRFIVAWMLSRKENSALASQLIDEATQRYGIQAGTLTLHQDRGAPMTAHGYLNLLAELSVTPSHSRPRVSNDNPMSEAHFKTLKYQPDYPLRFEHYAHAQRWRQDYVAGYNHRHHHSAVAGFTPAQVFTSEYRNLAQQQQAVLNDAFARHPDRFRRGKPTVKLPPENVYINPIPEGTDTTAESIVNFPTLKRCFAT